LGLGAEREKLHIEKRKITISYDEKIRMLTSGLKDKDSGSLLVKLLCLLKVLFFQNAVQIQRDIRC